MQLSPVPRGTLSGGVYAELRSALLEGRLEPGQRLKVRDLAASLGVSETPVREALLQLSREGALEMRPGASFHVVRLTLDTYLELRAIRLLLEGLAGEEAARRATAADIAFLEAQHDALVAAESAGAWREAVATNFRFHQRIWAMAAMPALLEILEGVWLRNGPLLNLLYPEARPTYPGRHRHLDILDGLRARDPAAVREAVRGDLLEGGRGLLRRLGGTEAEPIALTPRRTTTPPAKPARRDRRAS